MNNNQSRKISENLHIVYPKKSIIVGAVIISIITMLLFSGMAIIYRNMLKQNEVIQVQNRYIHFQDGMEEYMEIGVMLLRGYEAYLKTNGELTANQTKEYLSYLMKDNLEYIRNIGIIENTTIIYNYPLKGNESSIGVDLAKVENQRDNILKTKETMESVFQGPVNLVQGGQGYIIRVPMKNSEGSYWGQASIVLRADVINRKLNELAKRMELEILILEDETSEIPIIGEYSLLERNPFVFWDDSNNNWMIYATPIGGWKNYSYYVFGVMLIGLILSVIFALFYFNRRTSQYKLRYAMSHDQLTGVYNRHYLEHVEQVITQGVSEREKSYGFLHIDLDNFKRINDQFGHNTGDIVLKDVGRILGEITRRHELVFRIGGDEFLIIVPEVTDNNEMVLMRKRFEDDFDRALVNDEYLSLTRLSIGISVFPVDGKDFDTILKIADQDMYNQKRMHKGNNGK